MSGIYVLDYDLISPIGVGRTATLGALQSGFLAGSKISRFQVDGLPATHGAEVKADLSPFLAPFSEALGLAARIDRKLELSLAISSLVESRFLPKLQSVPESRRGIVFGVGLDITPIEFISEELRKNLSFGDANGPYFRTIRELNSEVSRLNRIANPLDISALAIARKMGLGAFQKTVLTACSASLQSVIYACKAIERGEADLVVAGGSDSLLNLVAYLAFSRLGVVLPIQGPPEKSCRPLDVNRSSVLVGEGSGLILLASEKGAKHAGNEPRFEVLGWGNSMDGYKITAPDPEGKGMRQAIQTAFDASGLSPEQVDCINLHGTGTRANDPAELNALIDVFGEAGESIAVSSTKDRHGHTIGAAGVVELGVLFLGMENDFVPCTANLEKPFLERGLQLVKGENLKRKVRHGMSNSFALGGVNSSIVIKNLGT